MTNYEAFVKALFKAEEEIAEDYGVTMLSGADGSTLDFYGYYYGIRLMFETLQNAEEQEKEHSYFRAYQKAEARVDKEEYLPRSYVFGREKANREVSVASLDNGKEGSYD